MARITCHFDNCREAASFNQSLLAMSLTRHRQSSTLDERISHNIDRNSFLSFWRSLRSDRAKVRLY